MAASGRRLVEEWPSLPASLPALFLPVSLPLTLKRRGQRGRANVEYRAELEHWREGGTEAATPLSKETAFGMLSQELERLGL